MDSTRVDRLPGLESVNFSGRPIPPVALARPTKGWPCGVTSLRPRARPFRLLVDPGDICPPQKRSCFKCGKSGHFIAQCPDKDNDQAQEKKGKKSYRKAKGEAHIGKE